MVRPARGDGRGEPRGCSGGLLRPGPGVRPPPPVVEPAVTRRTGDRWRRLGPEPLAPDGQGPMEPEPLTRVRTKEPRRAGFGGGERGTGAAARTPPAGPRRRATKEG